MEFTKALLFFLLGFILIGDGDSQTTKEPYFRMNVNGLSINGQILGGAMMHGFSFAQQGNILARKHIHYDNYTGGSSEWNVKLNYRFKNKFALEGGVTCSELAYGLVDKAFVSKLSTTNYTGEFNLYQNYFGPTISGYYFLSIAEYFMSVYFSPGMNFNFNMNYSSSSSTPPDYYGTSITQYASQTNQELDLTLHAKNFFAQYYLESGVAFSVYRFNMNISVKYTVSPNMLSGNYALYQNNALVYTDHLKAASDYFSAGVRIGWVLFQQSNSRIKHLQFRTPKTKKFKEQYIKPRY